MYYSTEIWFLPHIISKIKKGILKIGDLTTYNKVESGDVLDVLDDLIRGFPPIQIFIHRGKIYGDYFHLLYNALMTEDIAYIEVKNLFAFSVHDILNVKEDYISATILMDTKKFLAATKKFNQKTKDKLSTIASTLHETEFSVVKVDDSIKTNELIEYLDFRT